MPPVFDHERLVVYQKALEFVHWYSALLANESRGAVIRKQLERAATFIPLNIAEGNGKLTENDRCRFFDIARGSALECAACLDVALLTELVTADEAAKGKAILREVVSMLVGLIKSNSRLRVHEETAEYGAMREG